MKNIVRRFYLILIILLLIPILTSCWSNIDIGEQAFVVAIGYDKAENDMYEVTLQIVKPKVIRNGNKGGANEKAVWSFSSKGETLVEAVRNQLRTVNRRPFFSHMSLIIIGEELARDNIEVLFDFYERSREARLTPSILIAKGTTARNILNSISELDDISSMHIEGILNNNLYIADTLDVTVFDLIKQLDFCSKGYAIGTIQVREEEKNNPSNNVDEIKDKEVKGCGVFKNNKLVGWLDEKETRGLLFITDEVQGTIVTINNPKSEDSKLGIEIIKSKGKINVDVIDNEIKLYVDINAEGNLAENPLRTTVSEKKFISDIETKVTESITEEIKNTLNIAQNEYKTDFFGFNKKLYEKYPDLWKQNKPEWNSIFSELDIEVNVRFHLSHTGLIFN